MRCWDEAKEREEGEERKKEKEKGEEGGFVCERARGKEAGSVRQGILLGDTLSTVPVCTCNCA